MNQKKLTYRDAVAEIDDILEKIEQEELDVDELSEKVKRVSVLIRFCKEKLHKTGEEVENILKEMEE